MNGIKFNEVHSYYDLNVILSECPISPAEPKESYLDIPGADGSIDLTEALGDVKFSDRSGSLLLSVLPEDDFEAKKSEVSNFLNGKKFKFTLDKDPDYYYIGRAKVSDYKSDKKLKQISVDLTLQPWKLKQNVTTVTVKDSTAILMNDRMPAIPTVTLTDAATITFNGAVFQLSAGTHRILDVCLAEGQNEITVDGEAVFTYQEGSL